MLNPHRNSSRIIQVLKYLNVVLVSAAFYFCWKLFFSDTMRLTYGWRGNAAVTLVYAVLFVLLCRTYNGFDVGVLRISELIYSQSLAAFIDSVIVYILCIFISKRLPNPLPLLGLLCVQCGIISIYCLNANTMYFKLHPPLPTAVVYRGEEDLKRILGIRFFCDKFDIQYYVKAPKGYQEAVEQINGAQVVFISGIDATLRNGILKYCLQEGIQAYVKPKIGDIIISGAKSMQMFGEPIMHVEHVQLSFEYLLIKRVLDIIISLAAIIVSSPVMLIISIAIKAYDKDSIFYKQIRLTKDRKQFTILKFRSMCVDAEKDGHARLATEHDDRITPIGRIIRKLRLDELPQLFNILKGDMSVVGPRPERPEIAVQYEDDIGAFALRLQVKAGLTGFAQVYGRYNTEPYAKLQMDLMYINSMSIAQDIRLILATIKILFISDSTEGVEQGQTTAVQAKGTNETQKAQDIA